MHLTWISGWGVPPESLRAVSEAAFPGATLQIVPPTLRHIGSLGKSDLIVAWSLGARLLVEAAATGQIDARKAMLLSPFLNFCSDYGPEGRCSKAQVHWLLRWLKRDPVAALNDFYVRAQMARHYEALPYDIEDLNAGLELLANDASQQVRSFLKDGLPSGWQALVGENDALLHARGVASVFPGCRVIPGAGHDAQELLRGRQIEGQGGNAV